MSVHKLKTVFVRNPNLSGWQNLKRFAAKCIYEEPWLSVSFGMFAVSMGLVAQHGVRELFGVDVVSAVAKDNITHSLTISYFSIC
jgi:hypothetical protein